MPFNTLTVATAVTPGVIETYFSHYINRRPLKQKPTAHITYHEGIMLVRHFLEYASRHTVEDVQAFTAQYVPSPTWVRINDVDITPPFLERAASVMQAQFGERGLEKIGGKTWWQWRRPKNALRAEWIEMKKDFNERRRTGSKGERIIFYIHGGGYYFGSVDEHRYQMQRHARKLKARVLAPRYRLAPQFPFPCGLFDCLASYYFLLEEYDTSNIIVAGDSAGAGMTLAMLCILRDQKQPLPAGTILLSPWVDLTHSFPSLANDPSLDYIPPWGFVHRPSMAWPPAPQDDTKETNKTTTDNSEAGVRSSIPGSGNLKLNLDGEEIEIKEQIQMYAHNGLLSHPLVSLVMQPSLGGLPPMLIQTGGGELLRDEQIYIAHKAANPKLYPASDAIYEEFDPERKSLEYPPTYVQLQVWEDLCHVPHTLSFTRPAKYMYRSVAQFGAWALARAQNKGIDIQNDDAVSIISSGDEEEEETSEDSGEKQPPNAINQPQESVGKAGDPLPQFKDHMIRQRVTRHGIVYPLAPASELPALQMPLASIGAIKPGPVRKWLGVKKTYESKFASEWKKVLAKREIEKKAGYEDIPGENPPPTALAGRRKTGMASEEKKKGKSWGLALWSGWGSSHDEETLEREEKSEKNAEVNEEGDVVGGMNQSVVVPEGEGRGRAATARRPSSNSRRPTQRMIWSRSKDAGSMSRSPYHQVRDQGQTGDGEASQQQQRVSSPLAAETAAGIGVAGIAAAAGTAAVVEEEKNKQQQQQEGEEATSPAESSGGAPLMSIISPSSEKLPHTENTFLSPTSTRPHNNQMAYPFKLQVGGRTASTITLDSIAMVPATGTGNGTTGGTATPATDASGPAMGSATAAGAVAANGVAVGDATKREGGSSSGLFRTSSSAEEKSDDVAAAAAATAAVAGGAAVSQLTRREDDAAVTTNATSSATPMPASTVSSETNTNASKQQPNGNLHQRTSMLGSIGPDGMPTSHYEFSTDGAADAARPVAAEAAAPVAVETVVPAATASRTTGTTTTEMTSTTSTTVDPAVVAAQAAAARLGGEETGVPQLPPLELGTEMDKEKQQGERPGLQSFVSADRGDELRGGLSW